MIKSLRPTHKEAHTSLRKSKKPVTKKGKAREYELKEQKKVRRQKKKELLGKQRHRDKESER